MYDTLIFISGFLSLVALITFFVMANNIDKIRDQLKAIEKPNWHDEYQKRKFMNRPDPEILFAAQEYVWSQITLKSSLKKYEALKSTWSDRFKLLGAEFPEYPFK